MSSYENEFLFIESFLDTIKGKIPNVPEKVADALTKKDQAEYEKRYEEYRNAANKTSGKDPEWKASVDRLLEADKAKEKKHDMIVSGTKITIYIAEIVAASAALIALIKKANPDPSDKQIKALLIQAQGLQKEAEALKAEAKEGTIKGSVALAKAKVLESKGNRLLKKVEKYKKEGSTA